MNTRNEAAILAKHISSFLNEYIPTQKTASTNTLKAYQDTVGLYLQFLEGKGIGYRNLYASCFEKHRIEEWLGWLQTERNNRPEMRNNRLASLRTFLKYPGHKEARFLYLYQEAQEIDRFKAQKKKVEGLTRPAVKALLSAPDQSSHMGRRDLTLILMLYSTAARIDEILSMKVGQLHLDDVKPYAGIVVKGNKVKTLYLLPRTIAHLKKYLLEFHGDSPCADAYLFYSRNTGIYGKLTAAAGGHAKASHWLEDGMNIVQISFLLGHEQIQTTMVYYDKQVIMESNYPKIYSSPRFKFSYLL